MQLIKYTAVIIAWGLCTHILAQDMNRDTVETEPVEIDFLISYYDQDGSHSPVTGGEGTEKLTDVAPKIIVTVPLNAKTKLSFDLGLEAYTSASTDQIDPRMSGESGSDSRKYVNVGITKTKKENGLTYGLKVGASTEYDYTSLILGANIAKTSLDGNRELSFSAQAFIDTWQLIYPIELRGNGPLVPTNQRQSFNGALSYSQVINKRMQFSLSLEGVYMNGLLSTPFHRVYFAEQEQARVEKLPETRFKLPVGLRFNYFISDQFLARAYYRFYSDDWGIQGHTVSLEVPIKINRFFSVYPFARYHTQTEADYFKPYMQHTLDQTFYTSDFDLSGTNSQTFGVGIRYSPVNGISRMKISKKVLLMKGLDVRYANYSRSDGLNANNLSFGLNFTFD